MGRRPDRKLTTVTRAAPASRRSARRRYHVSGRYLLPSSPRRRSHGYRALVAVGDARRMPPRALRAVHCPVQSCWMENLGTFVLACALVVGVTTRRAGQSVLRRCHLTTGHPLSFRTLVAC